MLYSLFIPCNDIYLLILFHCLGLLLLFNINLPVMSLNIYILSLTKSTEEL